MIDEICYEVGALLYSPALNKTVADSIVEEKFGKQFSLALCLEDTVADGFVEQAELQLLNTIYRIRNARENKRFYLPKIFIRVRNPEQLLRIHAALVECCDVITGYIFPKYSVDNMERYNEYICKINDESNKKIYMMPTLESRDIVDYTTRFESLVAVKKAIDSVKEYVLNVRVGGNDFSNEFSVRRHYDETIYDILPIGNLLAEILTLFSREYIVSGPVWEFFASDNNEWKEGLKREVAKDRLNGFVGKTVIHPKQIEVVNEAFKVSRKDYEDAKIILGWDETKALQVGKSAGGDRMNEVKTHGNWALKTIMLARIYGIS
ncbi:HpcH/HpaI aldolase/citrate lyase family protein [Butyrivibrio sp. AC2005]|uniref:HpcH/HpaI aldolase/citrate lyase family protein n=1 Tax=Butyrivibrio sp. AC2005 TaxID=1280672 RepID=UPI00041F298E|nr:HpcH/HpaI aldolase/citrate lyase family protein [Butyrivibrio sp. AC2005]